MLSGKFIKFLTILLVAGISLLPSRGEALAPPSPMSDTERHGREDSERDAFITAAYSDYLLSKALHEGRFFAIKNLVNTNLQEFFTGSSAEVAERFAREISFKSDDQKRDTIEKMVEFLDNRDTRLRLHKAFGDIQRILKSLQNLKGEKGLEDRRFVVLTEGVQGEPLMYTRTVEGRPVNILARASRSSNAICFNLDAVEYYQKHSSRPLKSLGAIIRTENAYIQGKEDTLTLHERKVLDVLQDGYLAKRITADKDLWERLHGELLAVVVDSKAAGVENDNIKKPLEEKIKSQFGAHVPIQWHLIESSDGRDYFLFTVAGRRFNLIYNSEKKTAGSDFTTLRYLYDQLCFLVELAVPDYSKRADTGSTWEDLSEDITYLYIENYERLERRGRRDIIALLVYAMDLDYSNGYLDEIRSLIRKINDNADVPPIFAEKPLNGKEFVVTQAIFGRSARNQLPEIIELSAIHYRGFRPVRKFRTYVKPRREGTLQTAAKMEIDPAVFEQPGTPNQDRALRQFRAFIGDLPLVTHGGMGKVKEISQLLAAQGEQPLVNSVLDTNAIAKRFYRVNSPEFPYDKHTLPSLFEHFGMESPEKVIKGYRLLRLYRLLIEEMALLAKKDVDEKGKSWEYQRMLDHLGQPDKVAQRREFERVRKEFHEKFMRVTNWETIKAVIMSTDPKKGGVGLLVLDFDSNVAGSKGWMGSDDWYRWEVRYVEQYGGNFFLNLDKTNRFLTAMSFFELMEGTIPEIIRAAQSKGIKVVILTARQPWPGHREFLQQALKNMGIDLLLEDLILTGTATGSVNKPGGLLDYCRKNYAKLPNMLYVDDGLKYLEAMARHPELSDAMKLLCWYDVRTKKPADYRFGEFLAQGKELIKKDPSEKDAIGYLYNAFGLARDQAARDDVIKVGETILKLLPGFRGEKNFSDFLRGYISSSIRDDPELKRALLLHEIRKKIPGERIEFQDFFSGISDFWGDVGLDAKHARYIINDSQLLREMEISAVIDRENRLVGMKITALKEPKPKVIVLSTERGSVKARDDLRKSRLLDRDLPGRKPADIAA